MAYSIWGNFSGAAT